MRLQALRRSVIRPTSSRPFVHAFVDTMRNLNVSPHIAGKNATSSMIDGRTTRHPGYDLSQKKRTRVEEIFGWLKTIGLMRKTRHRGSARDVHVQPRHLQHPENAQSPGAYRVKRVAGRRTDMK